tara:strand:+ start:820 stop:1014 length:195 start_codon:yes stop_codon:yes gene_type:complete
MAKVKITARIGKDISEEIIVNSDNFIDMKNTWKSILDNEEYYLIKRMGKKYGQSIDEVEWEELN